MARRTTAGQNLELRWRRDNELDLRPEDYFDLVLQKTCCYTTIYPLRVGALVGTRGALDDAGLEPISQFGYYLGAAFQIRDDLLNVVGDEARYGKEVGGDLREGKRTLMLIHLLGAASPDDRGWLAAYLAAPISERRPDEVQRVFAMMETYGSLDFAETWGGRSRQRPTRRSPERSPPSDRRFTSTSWRHSCRTCWNAATDAAAGDPTLATSRSLSSVGRSGRVAQLVRALPRHGRGPRFESVHAHRRAGQEYFLG